MIRFASSYTLAQVHSDRLVGSIRAMHREMTRSIDRYLGSKASEHHDVNGTDTSARQHCYDRLGHHRHVDHDSITCYDSVVRQYT